MLNITIDAKVPDFFRKLHINKIKGENRLTSINDWIKSKCSDDFYNEYLWLINTCIDFRTQNGQYHVPIVQFSLDNQLIVEIGGKQFRIGKYSNETSYDYETKISFNILDRIVAVSSIWNHFNLFDNRLYFMFTTTSQGEKPYKGECEAIIDQFKLQPFLDWFNGGSILQEYFDQLNTIESKIELQLYDKWLNHNIQLTKTTAND